MEIFLLREDGSKGYLSKKTLLLAGAMIILTAGAVYASDDDAGPFRQGSLRFSLLIGGGTAFDQNYTIFGLGAGYYVADYLELGLDIEDWTGNTPHIYRFSPGLRYVLLSGGAIRPYIGAFYRRTVIEGEQGIDAVGARAGVLILSGQRAYFGVGLADDVYLNCDRTVYSSCSEVYPELMVGISF